MPRDTTTPMPTRTRLWWRVLVVALVSAAGVLGAVACGLAWLLMGFMGTAVEPWEPVAYPAGVAACVGVPILVGRRLIGGRGRAAHGMQVLAVAAVVVATAVVAATLGSTG